MGVNLINPVTGDPIPIDGIRSVEDCKLLMLEFCYPIGSIYTSTDSTSPATFLGGTWISLDGYMLRAADGTTNVVTPNQNQNDGGADTHKLIANELASHGHNFAGGWGNGSTHERYKYGDVGTASTYGVNNNGGNQAHNNLPKYKNVYMWERTA